MFRRYASLVLILFLLCASALADGFTSDADAANEAANPAPETLADGNPIPNGDDRGVRLCIKEAAEVEYEKVGNDLYIRIQVSSTAKDKNIKSFTLKAYTDSSEEKEKELFRTDRIIKPGSPEFSDYMVLPDYDKINNFYCAVYKVNYSDGTTYAVADSDLEFFCCDIQ